ncbi:hypothetical protein ASE01_08625 [Nocardioides sp. Root190]|uniref:hypothetical protein n=1 Tax=Nocardioides sp. Root190 TaxID=1736488 RepID=UPI0006FB981D|nr:hypothetical protein [Nocardioides sp. Root190]KRB78204.1 hypothetical protein ASE01_08625 [Nocardioides sp. Root190]
MSSLDFDGQRRLEALQARGSGTRFHQVAPVTGTDPETRLALTVDAARRVVAAIVPDASLVRTSGLLAAAVRVAFQDADLARARASRERSGDRPPPADASGLVDVSALLRPAATRERGVARRTRATVAGGAGGAGGATATVPSLAATGRSANGFLLVTVGPTGVVEDVEADAGWLAGAREQFLESALVQAFQEAALTKVGETR